MFACFAAFWSKKFGRIDAVKRHTGLSQDGRLFCSAPYQAGPKTRQAKESQNQKQLKANVTELFAFERASLVLLVL